MDNAQIRGIVADMLQPYHGNPEFIRQIKEGAQDDGPYMQAAYAVRDWVMQEMAKPQQLEVIEE
jgi:hypothetical protein